MFWSYVMPSNHRVLTILQQMLLLLGRARARSAKMMISAAMTIWPDPVSILASRLGKMGRALTDEDLPSSRPDNGAQVFRDVGHLDITACEVIILIVLITSGSCARRASVPLLERICEQTYELHQLRTVP